MGKPSRCLFCGTWKRAGPSPCPRGSCGFPADFAPEGGLSGDRRRTATAQAAAECLRRAGVRRLLATRSLPLLFADFIRRAGMTVECDPQMEVVERRLEEDEEKMASLREAQSVTEDMMAPRAA